MQRKSINEGIYTEQIEKFLKKLSEMFAYAVENYGKESKFADAVRELLLFCQSDYENPNLSIREHLYNIKHLIKDALQEGPLKKNEMLLDLQKGIKNTTYVLKTEIICLDLVEKIKTLPSNVIQGDDGIELNNLKKSAANAYAWVRLVKNDPSIHGNRDWLDQLIHVDVPICNDLLAKYHGRKSVREIAHKTDHDFTDPDNLRDRSVAAVTERPRSAPLLSTAGVHDSLNIIITPPGEKKYDDIDEFTNVTTRSRPASPIVPPSPPSTAATPTPTPVTTPSASPTPDDDKTPPSPPSLLRKKTN